MHTYDHIVIAAEQTVRDAWQRVAGSRLPHALEHLLTRYREPHRHYHDLRHLAAVLAHIDEIAAHTPAAGAPDDLQVVLLAALFHDAVYEPRAADNEAASAALARACASELGWSARRCASVERLVLATAPHAPATTVHTIANDEALLLDADLAVLAAAPAEYAAYVRSVRREYAHVGDDQWRAGRAAVLHALLQRPALFNTRYMARVAEAQARHNMLGELDSLGVAADRPTADSDG